MLNFYVILQLDNTEGDQALMKNDLKSFIRFLSEERGLAQNTLDSYERDLQQYIHFFWSNQAFIR